MSEFDLPEAPSRLLPRTAEIRKRLPQAVIALVGLGVVGYFAYHAIHGDRGLLAWKALDRDVVEARSDLEAIRAERLTLEKRVSLLRLESLDLDMLDEWSRRVLNYSAGDEAVIFTREDDAGLRLDEQQGPAVPVEPERRALGER
ncbi:MAG: FtsB family cell division protein [Solirubrobacterales bacterium]